MDKKQRKGPRKRMAPLYFFFLFIFFIPAISAGTYFQVGGSDRGYQGADTIWENDSTITTILLNSGAWVPLVYDLDGDGNNEIVMRDQNNVQIRDTHLALIDYIAFNSTAILYQPTIALLNNSPRIVFYIGGSNLMDIALMRYNGSLTTISYFDVPQMTENSGLGAITCTTGYCLLASDWGRTTTSFSGQLYTTFNYSAIIDFQNGTQTTPGDNHIMCQPAIGGPTIFDYDSDGQDEIIWAFTDWGLTASTNDRYIIETLPINSSGKMSGVERSFTRSSTHDILSGSTISCAPGAGAFGNQMPGAYISAPLVYNWVGSDSSPKEIMLAYQFDTNGVAMKLYDYNFNEIDDYPESTDFPGIGVSGIVRAETDAWSSAGKLSGCIQTSGVGATEINILCANPRTTDPLRDSVEFFYDVEGFPNVSIASFEPRLFMHSVDWYEISAGYTPSTSIDTSEFVTAYGIFMPNLDATSCAAFGFCGLSLLDDFTYQNYTYVPVDARNAGRADIIGVGKTSLVYLDDGFDNLDCASEQCLASYVLSPCLNQTWEINTSVQVQIVPQDVEDDVMQARAVLYSGETSEQDSGWSANITAGAGVTFSFTANATTPLSTLILYAREGQTPAVIDSESLSYSVSVIGVEGGECTTTFSFGSPVTAAAAPTSPAGTILDIPASLENTGALFGVNGTAVYWLLLLILIGMVSFKVKQPSIIAVSVIAILLVGSFLGLALGIIGVGTLIIEVVIAMLILFLGMMFKRGG